MINILINKLRKLENPIIIEELCNNFSKQYKKIWDNNEEILFKIMLNWKDFDSHGYYLNRPLIRNGRRNSEQLCVDTISRLILNIQSQAPPIIIDDLCLLTFYYYKKMYRNKDKYKNIFESELESELRRIL